MPEIKHFLVAFLASFIPSKKVKKCRFSLFCMKFDVINLDGARSEDL